MRRDDALPVLARVRFVACAHAASPALLSRLGQVGTVKRVVRRNGGWAAEVAFGHGAGQVGDLFTLEPEELEAA